MEVYSEACTIPTMQGVPCSPQITGISLEPSGSNYSSANVPIYNGNGLGIEFSFKSPISQTNSILSSFDNQVVRPFAASLILPTK